MLSHFTRCSVVQIFGLSSLTLGQISLAPFVRLHLNELTNSSEDLQHESVKVGIATNLKPPYCRLLQ